MWYMKVTDKRMCKQQKSFKQLSENLLSVCRSFWSIFRKWVALVHMNNLFKSDQKYWRMILWVEGHIWILRTDMSAMAVLWFSHLAKELPLVWLDEILAWGALAWEPRTNQVKSKPFSSWINIWKQHWYLCLRLPDTQCVLAHACMSQTHVCKPPPT